MATQDATISGPSVLVIIPSRGYFQYARNAAWSLLAHCSGVACDYVIIDDASPDWLNVDWSSWPAGLAPIHFDTSGGLTRSWNAGLELAIARKADFAVCTNSDVVFSPRWCQPLIRALETGFDLVGPVTNAPGHATWQHAGPFLGSTHRVLDDSEQSISGAAEALVEAGVGPIEAMINGFFMMAKTDTWRKGAFSPHHVFNPSFPFLHNEVELQTRWQKYGLRIGFSPQSYVFHYLSVSREACAVSSRFFHGAYRPLP